MVDPSVSMRLDDSYSVFDDWDFLQQVQDDLDDLSSRSNIPIENDNPKQRAKSLSLLLETLDHWPESWQRISLEIYTDVILTEFIARLMKRFKNIGANGEEIADLVRKELIFVCIRNAGTWHNRPDRGQNWRGFLLAHARKLTLRFAQAEKTVTNAGITSNSIAREWQPEDLLLQNEANEFLQTAMQELTAHERLLVELRFVDSLSIAEVARQLRLKYSTAADGINRTLVKLRRSIVAKGWDTRWSP